MHSLRVVGWLAVTVPALMFPLMSWGIADQTFDAGGKGALFPLDEIAEEFDPAGEFGEKADAELEEFQAESIQFLNLSALLLFLGLAGYGLMATSVANRRSRPGMLPVVLGMAGGSLAGFFLIGFDMAYPGEFRFGGLLGEYREPWFANLTEDPFGDIMGMTLWTDFLFQAAFAVMTGVLVSGLAARSLRFSTVIPSACLCSVAGYPLVTSWNWGGGWLMREAYDFAGSGNVHVLAGSCGLALVALARLAPSKGPLGTFADHERLDSRPDSGPRISGRWAVLFAVGAALFLIPIVGSTGGSMLTFDSGMVAQVLFSTATATIGGALAAGVVCIQLAGRSRGLIIVLGALAGWVAACAPADQLDWLQAMTIGAMAGALASLILWLMDRSGMDDPLGLVAVHLTGGTVGLVAAGVLIETVSLTHQLIFAAAIATVGLTIGGTVGLIGWMTGLLWRPDAGHPIVAEASNHRASVTCPPPATP